MSNVLTKWWTKGTFWEWLISTCIIAIQINNDIWQWCRNRNSGGGGHLALYQPKRADYSHLLLLAPSKFFTFRHHCLIWSPHLFTKDEFWILKFHDFTDFISSDHKFISFLFDLTGVFAKTFLKVKTFVKICISLFVKICGKGLN